ncbi:GTP cyclohydrolase 1 type 2/Nif3 [Piptocephalis cylindrospora]|uniref:GTP cyclohydrolase 1 type 2/Nif3 n=1 Tax=Piptocephalis cylindrospora TaxID=1907219 RepID=A0A4V1IXL6_9FUNG|nr:GTP cyclohydrolase 1 type 2/Nif3 [Piptocephalis cylindrospora]|eukprot:RKP11489.1 GTP cyclohydrolase 1 type 2/Nif3 [Piptocephalis cylindrospora]
MATPLVHRVARTMGRYAPLSLAETSWDNVGTLLEPPKPRKGNRILLTIDLSAPVLAEALADEQVSVILAYHPAIFRGIKRFSLSDHTQRTVLECAAAGIGIYSPHTSLDACEGGINDWLAQGCGSGTVEPITPADNPPEVNRVKKHLRLEHLRLASYTPEKPVHSIAICAGSGASMLGGVKADVYLTGEMSHHEVLAALHSDTSVILCEHSNSERGFLSQVLQPYLQKAFEKEGQEPVDVVVSKVDRDPLCVV